VLVNRQDRDNAKKRMQRRAFPIAGYVGPNGSGKSWLAVYDSLPSLDAGRPVLSTVRLLDFRDPRPCPGGGMCDDPANHIIERSMSTLVEGPDGRARVVQQPVPTGAVHQASHPYYVPFRDYSQLLDMRDCDIIMDEVTGVASSREVASMPVQVANHLVQLRRRNQVLRWTTPSWGRADKIIREVTQLVTLCSGHMPKKRPQVEGEAPRLWLDRRLFWCKSYDPSKMDEFEAHRADSIIPEIRAFYWRPIGVTQHAYDTLAGVSALGWANDAGLCMSCGGKRTHRKCACVPDQAGVTPRQAAGRSVAPAQGLASL
jgi:hypothetical protein